MIYPSLYVFDEQCRTDAGGAVCGVDEAGRGPLAGPVFAGAVILPPGLVLDGLRDSKKVTKRRRDALFDEIVESAVAFGIGAASVEEIDRLNILGATFVAMERAVNQLVSDFAPENVEKTEQLPQAQLPFARILVDGNRLPPQFAGNAQTVVHGDDTSASIAAASILAKVSRDRYLQKLDEQYPIYGFAKHKGYGTAQHLAMLRQYGPCPAHRRSFLTKILPGEELDDTKR